MTETTLSETSALKAGKNNERKPSGIGRWTGIIVFASVALPILAAYIVFYTGAGMPSGTVNQGELLIPAQQVGELELLDRSGNPIELASEDPKWRFLIIGDQSCVEECEKLLYTTRQVHIRLSEKASRVERLLITGGSLEEPLHSDLAARYPLLRYATADQKQLDHWLAESNHAQLPRPSVLLVDQNGFAMMVYGSQHSGNQVLKDIKRLLKYSYEK
ncbi:hypothetical protein [Microbulbifer elongatus]|uniref:hypothetical protein n=1 Tax=Microbulbifer elongatus TaxID=86173 RepID=UPI001CFD34BF|nr:hypothetical protein [Microbulbifer elongatus]